MKKIINILIFFMLCSLSFSEIKVNVSDSTPTVKQNIILNIEFLNEPKPEYNIEGIENFDIISVGNRSNYSTLNNKKIKYSKSDIYVLSPKKEGKFNLLIKSKNNEVSNLITLNVSKEIKASAKEPKLFLETTRYKRDYYYGEKIPFVEKVIIKTSISNYNYVAPPMFNGFSIKNITPRDGKGFAIPKRVTVNGKEQIELVLFRSILEPESYGNKLIETGGISIIELTEDDQEKKPVYLGFKEFNLNILPLPEENKPENFQGIVGELKGNYKWTNDIIDGKEAYILNLKLYGSVNLDNLEKVVFYDDKNFDVRETTTVFEEHVLDHVYSAEKKYTIAFVPNTSEDVTPSDIKIPFFNPVEQKYDEFIIDFEESEIIKGNSISQNTNKEKPKFIFSENVKPNTAVNNENQNNKNLQQTKVVKIISEDKYKKEKTLAIIILGILVFIEGVYIIKLKGRRKEKNGSDK